MKCPECKHEIGDCSTFCNNCGVQLLEEALINDAKNTEDIEKTDRVNKVKGFVIKTKGRMKSIWEKLTAKVYQDKRVFALFSVVTLLLITGLVAGAIYFNSPIKKIERLCNSGKYHEAKLVYSEVIARENNVNKKDELNSNLKEFIVKKAGKIEHDYIAERIDYRTASDVLINMLIFDVANNEVDVNWKNVDQLKDSRKYYQAGLEKIAKKDYAEGIDNLSKVIKEDPNYNDSEKQITKVLPNVRKQKLAESESAYKANDYEKAIDSISFLVPYFGNDTEINKKLEFYKSEHGKAIAAEIQRKENRKQELLAMTTSNYDDMQDETIIVPKGLSTRYVNVDWDMNIYPQISVEPSGKAGLFIIAGFKQNDWIFFDSVIFNVDGKRFTWDLSGFNNTRREVFWGGIAEWTLRTYLPQETIDIAEEYNLEHKCISGELIEQMTQLSNANIAKMRFQGKGYKDHVLTINEKANLKTFLELYDCYEH